jgi:hypothetical protein
MPHTIIDIREPLSIPAGQFGVGIDQRCHRSCEQTAFRIQEFAGINGKFNKGEHVLRRRRSRLYRRLSRIRIHHILEANGAFCDAKKTRGHAQKNQNISFNTIQPYPEGDQRKVLYPTIIIRP